MMSKGASRRLRSASSVQSQRQDEEVLRLRMDMLRGRDRALAEMYLERGASFREMARIAGMNEVTLSRRMKRIFRRLRSWGLVRAAKERGMGPIEERIAREYLVRGRSQRVVAARLGCTRYAVQKVLRAVKASSGQMWPLRNRGIEGVTSDTIRHK